MTKPENTDRKQKKDTRFKPGVSGNPTGKPKGSRHKTTLAAQVLLDGETESLTRKAVEMALGGDMAALRLCLERILPPVRERPVSLQLPSTLTVKGIERASDVILKAVAKGTLLPSEGTCLLGMIEKRRLAVETTNLEQRISELENTK